MTALAQRLATGNPRTLGATNAIVQEALSDPALLPELVACLTSPSDLVRSRAANALRKIVTARPGSLDPHAKSILRAGRSPQPPHARWNLTLLLGAIDLKPRDRALAVDLLFESLQSATSFERTFAMQALADLAMNDPPLRARLLPVLAACTENGTAAMRARGRKLLRKLTRSF